MRKAGEGLRAGDRVRVVIGDVAFGGDGVARVDGMAVFVPFAVDGDTLEVEIAAVQKRFARARLLRVLEPSPQRVTPRCPWYMRCGGCQLQHVAYGHQLALKGRQVAEALRRIAGLADAPLLPVVPSPRPFGWRGKAEFHVGRERGEARTIGLMAVASQRIVEIERCAIVDETINRKLQQLRDAIRTGGVRVAGERQRIWSDGAGEPPTPLFTAAGPPPDVTRVVRGRRLAVPGRGFFQANAALVDTLVARVVAAAALTGGERVVDAYAGAGLFSLFLAEAASSLVAIEGEPEAARCARINLAADGRTHAEAVCGDVAEVLARRVQARAGADLVVLDPPRDGCGERVVDAVAGLRPARIVYVSCNPATLARDLRRLAGCGYGVERVEPLDMFPQTGHIELVVTLLRRFAGVACLQPEPGRCPAAASPAEASETPFAAPDRTAEAGRAPQRHAARRSQRRAGRGAARRTKGAPAPAATHPARRGGRGRDQAPQKARRRRGGENR